jgi:hypothetical protein
MKKLSLIISFLFAIVSGNILNATHIKVAADTLNYYVINGQPVDKFDGSQVEGKNITSYDITIITPPNQDPVRVHEILTDGYSHPQMSIKVRPTGASDLAVYVIDGKKASKKEFENLNPMEIESIKVVKNGTLEEVKKYEGWENGVIMVETKVATSRDRKK